MSFNKFSLFRNYTNFQMSTKGPRKVIYSFSEHEHLLNTSQNLANLSNKIHHNFSKFSQNSFKFFENCDNFTHNFDQNYGNFHKFCFLNFPP
jgi:hypothetical protein